MRADYITLTDGRRVRIEWNMNALGEFTVRTGKEMSDLAGFKADIKTLRVIAWCSAVEGEACDGKELGLSEIEFGRIMNMQSIIEFSEIFRRQNEGIQKKNDYQEKSPRTFFRKKG
jgi:hypothetical protein